MAARARGNGWAQLFWAAFGRSRNAMLLTDDRRVILDANAAIVNLLRRDRDSIVGRPLWELVAGGPLASKREWADALLAGRFDGKAELRAADSTVQVQWAATVETVTGGRRVLFVAINASRSGAHFRPTPADVVPTGALTPRQREVVHLIALGAAGPEIATELQISHETVRTHARNAMVKLGARSRAHLVARALGEGRTFR